MGFPECQRSRTNETKVESLIESFSFAYIYRKEVREWAKMTKTSTNSSLRDIKDLVAKGILQQTKEGGRSVNYELVVVEVGDNNNINS